VNIIVGFLLTGLVGGALTHYYNQKQRDIEYYRTQQQKESERLRTEQQRESERLRDERQKEFQFQRDAQQREAERIRILSLELNKLRLEKVGELVEKTYLYEESLKTTFRKAVFIVGSASESIWNLKKSGILVDFDLMSKEFHPYYQEFVKTLGPNELLYKDLINSINRNRFWVGEEVYKQIHNHVEELFVSSERVRIKFLNILDPKKREPDRLYDRESLGDITKDFEKTLGKSEATLSITYRKIRDELLKE
jgi:hypothetical protein